MTNLGKKIAKESDHKCYHHAAIVQRGGAVLSHAANYGWRHAERRAIDMVSPDKRKNLKVWSLRTLANGSFGNAKPCEECEDYMRINGVKMVYFSNDNGDIESMKL